MRCHEAAHASSNDKIASHSGAGGFFESRVKAFAVVDVNADYLTQVLKGLDLRFRGIIEASEAVNI